MQYAEFDKKYLWHPFTQALTAKEPICVVKGRGAYLIDEHNKKYLDLISSWWVCVHGHSHRYIAKKIYKQALELEQVIFAGFTHPAALKLCEKLLHHLPQGLERFFFSDNGSTAVEVALKMSYQYFYNLQQSQRTIFLHFEGGYHGDTFGAMAVGKSSEFYKPFEQFCFQTIGIPFADTWDQHVDIIEYEKRALETLEKVLVLYRGRICSFIMEPLLQGASGMRSCRKEFIQKICERLKEEGILIIFDEVMTGFYRTGSFFASHEVEIKPDFLCLSKALSGGFLPLALTVTTQEIYQAFLSHKNGFAFLHGHSFTANPLGCAAGIASLELFEKPQFQKKINLIHKAHKSGIAKLVKTGFIEKTFVRGTVARFELKQKDESSLIWIKQQAEIRGFIIRPLKNAIYIMPPYCITKKQLNEAYDMLLSLLNLRFNVLGDQIACRPCSLEVKTSRDTVYI